MEQFKNFDEINQIDHRHVLVSQLNGRLLSLDLLYLALSEITLHIGVPEDVRSQFNVAKNMALYTYFQYSLAPEVQMKTFAVIELSLRCRFPENEKKTLAPLLARALKEGLLKDSGFRQLVDINSTNNYSKGLVGIVSSLRNGLAHGSTSLSGECVGHIQICADLINQLFANVGTILSSDMNATQAK